MSLDLAVARSIHVNRILERALHAPEGWTIALDTLHLPVVRVEHLDGVSFTTAGPDVELLVPVMLGLYHHGELLDCRQVFPGESLQEIVWELSLISTVAA